MSVVNKAGDPGSSLESLSKAVPWRFICSHSDSFHKNADKTWHSFHNAPMKDLFLKLSEKSYKFKFPAVTAILNHCAYDLPDCRTPCWLCIWDLIENGCMVKWRKYETNCNVKIQTWNKIFVQTKQIIFYAIYSFSFNSIKVQIVVDFKLQTCNKSH